MPGSINIEDNASCNKMEYMEKKLSKDEKSTREGNMEEALDATGFGKFHIWITLTGGFILCVVNTESWSIGYVIPSAECDLDLSLQEKSVLVTVGAVGILTTQFIWGYLSDRLGRRNIMLYTLAAGSLCTILSVLAPTYWMVALFRFLNGTFVAAATGLSFPYIGEFFSARYRSLAILVMSIFIGIALILIPFMAWIIIPLDFSGLFFGLNVASWRVFVLVCGSPAIIACIALYLSPESPKFLAQSQRCEEALSIMRKMHKLNNVKTPYPIEKLSCEETDNDGHMWDLFNRQYVWKTLLVCTIQSGVFATSGGLFLWYPHILQQISRSKEEITVCQALNLPFAPKNTLNNTSTDTECIINIDSSVFSQNMLLGLGFTIGYVVISALVNKIGIKAILIIFLGLSGLATFTLHFITHPIAIDILFILLLVLSGLCVVVVNTAVVEIYPTNLRGMAVCLTMLSGRVGSIVTSSLLGYLLVWNCEVSFMLFAASLIGSSLITFLLPSKGPS